MAYWQAWRAIRRGFAMKGFSPFLYSLVFLAFSFLSVAASHADFYKYVDEEGVIHITNVPTSGKYVMFMRENKKSALASKGKAPVRDIKQLEDIIFTTSYKYGVDPVLVKAIVKAESDFKPLAVSVDGARGLMQLMPETARLYSVRDIHDPEENIEGGTRHLSKLLKMFNWNIRLAVAAYNAGENAVLKYGAVPPYSETRDYVAKVMGYYNSYRGGS